ncbi:MAG: glycosyltransferase family 2 protein [Actinomycetota bacterium]|nr:glycosyltransferase family 2 protein [Actinomycetota bacterium]
MGTQDPLALAVAVVSFDTRDVLHRCLDSVVAARPAETIVVDNGSRDGSAELVRTRFPSVRLIVNETNRGYGFAANQAVAASSLSAVLLLNSDTILRPDALPALGSYLARHPRAAVAGPRLANADGSLQRSTYPFPSVADTVLGESGLHLLMRRLPWVRERFWRTWSHDAARPVPWVLGAALAIRRDAFQALGGFDEQFFMYGEELDLCRRLRAAGLEVHFAPVTTVTHLGGASTGQRVAAMRRQFVVSMRRYLVRHESPRSTARVLGVLRALAAARMARDALQLRVARSAAERERLRRSLAGWKAMLAERELWRP